MFQWLNGWFSNTPKSREEKIKKVKAAAPKVKTKAPAPTKPKMTKTTLSKMTKKELEEIGRKNGIELDRRLTKLKLVDQLHKHLKK